VALHQRLRDYRSLSRLDLPEGSRHVRCVTPAERLTEALVKRLHANGVLSDADLMAIADDLESILPDDGDEGEALADLANGLRCTIVEASAPSASDWNAGLARSRLRVVTNEPR